MRILKSRHKTRKGDNLAPGGFIYSSSREMSNYMRLLLNNGVIENDTIVSPKIINEIFKPQIISYWWFVLQ
jgi:hypothetical protein